MLVSEGHTASGYVMTSGLHCYLGDGDISALATAKNHVWICDPTTARVCVATRGYMEAQEQDRNLQPCWCLRVMSPLEFS